MARSPDRFHEISFRCTWSGRRAPGQSSPATRDGFAPCSHISRRSAHLVREMASGPATGQAGARAGSGEGREGWSDSLAGRIDRRSVEAYQRAKLSSGLAAKTVSNQVRFLHGIFRYAIGQEWASRNPVAGIEYPGDRNHSHEIRALTAEELESLIAAVPDDHLGPIDRILYATAAMTGMRKGELQALRWMDVDWSAQVIRVRRSYSFGEFTKPKSQRAARAVPMSERQAE